MNFELQYVSYEENKNTADTVIKLVETLGVEIERSLIFIAHRLPRKHNSKQKHQRVARFGNLKIRNVIYANRFKATCKNVTEFPSKKWSDSVSMKTSPKKEAPIMDDQTKS